MIFDLNAIPLSSSSLHTAFPLRFAINLVFWQLALFYFALFKELTSSIALFFGCDF
jgi:hypothetical protein